MNFLRSSLSLFRCPLCVPSIAGVILSAAGCSSLDIKSSIKEPFDQSALREMVKNSAAKHIRIKAFNLTLSHMAKKCDSNYNARCGIRFCELLSAQQGLTRCFALQHIDKNDVLDLGVWLGVNGRTRISNTGPIKVYECSLFSAAMGIGSGNGSLLTNETFVVERPLWSNSNTVIDEDAVISEALYESANRICSVLRCRFPITGCVISSPLDGWIMVDKGTGDGVLPNDLILLYKTDGDSVALIGVAEATPQSGRSLGKIVWEMQNGEKPSTVKGVSVIIGPQELFLRIQHL